MYWYICVSIAFGTAAISRAKVKVVDEMLMPAYFATAFAFEISIVVRAYSIGNISGRHVNPEVSLGVILFRKTNGRDFIGCVIVQLLGAIS
ncbi:aquaporin [Megasphaera sp.]|uniref:aquaporin n=1 Tax=Megasphaera sp. TaxID=2023260 RepID=UPI004029F19D